MPGIKELKNRIRSIGSTRKITKAMQMVSAAKMRKAQNATLASRTYASLSWELILNLTQSMDSVIARSASDEAIPLEKKEIASDALAMTKLLQPFPDAKKIGVVLLTTNRGLVGSLNTNLMAKVKEIDGTNTSNHEVIAEVISYGKNAKTLAGRLGKNILADFAKLDKTIATEDIFPLAKYVTDLYKTGQYKKIAIVYNHFVSTLVQKPTIKQLLPFTETVKNFSEEDEGEGKNGKGEELDSTYIFEPGPDAVLDHLLPRIIESQIYQTILESDASEHSARMVMMKNATEAAGDLISDLTLTYNQLRQNKITTELAEITAGRIALE